MTKAAGRVTALFVFLISVPGVLRAEEAPSIAHIQPGNSIEAERIPVVVFFNRSLNTKGTFDNDCIKFENETRGETFWAGQDVCYFIPAEAWKPGTTIKYRVSERLIRNARELGFTVKSKPFKLLDYQPSKSGKLSYRPVFRLFFNQQVDLTQLKDSVELIAD